MDEQRLFAVRSGCSCKGCAKKTQVQVCLFSFKGTKAVSKRVERV